MVRQETSSELLTHLDLLGKTVQFISEIANHTFSAADLDSEDLKSWRKMEQVLYEIEKEFIKLYHSHNEQLAKRSVLENWRPR